MTRGYFVEEKGKKIYGAKIKSDAYLSGIGRCIIEAFAKGEEKAYMKKLRQEMDEKQREDLDQYICPEWYHITKKSEKDAHVQEYGYVLKGNLLKVYNYGKLFITITRETATEWVYLCDNEHLINDSLLYSDKKLRHEYSKEFSVYRYLQKQLDAGIKAVDIVFPVKRYSYMDLSDNHTMDVWHRSDAPAYLKFLKFKDIANEIKFIASLEFGKWRVAIQLPYIRIPLSVQPARTETGVMKNLREYIKNNENALRDFLLVSNKYDEVKKQMISDFGITSITDVEVNNMKSFGDYIRQFENYVKDKNWLFQSSYFSVNKAINNLREEYDRLIMKVDSIAM